jgi:hypothetical protein
MRRFAEDARGNGALHLAQTLVIDSLPSAADVGHGPASPRPPRSVMEPESSSP